jgi:hypothetical protein
MAEVEGGRVSQRVKRVLLIAAGSVSLGLGVLGVFVPLLPTTPFLLLAATCYVNSSPRLYDWLMNSPRLGRYLRDYRSGAGVPRQAKVVSISLLWLTIGFSVVFVVAVLWLRVLLLLIAVGVTWHLLSLPTSRG